MVLMWVTKQISISHIAGCRALYIDLNNSKLPSRVAVSPWVSCQSQSSVAEFGEYRLENLVTPNPFSVECNGIMSRLREYDLINASNVTAKSTYLRDYYNVRYKILMMESL